MQGEMLLFSGSSHPELTYAIAQRLGISVGKSQVIRFSNENLMIRIGDNVREKDVFVVQTSAPPVSDKIVELLIFLDALKYASAARVTAVVPYFFYSRSDKKDEPRISIAARLMADLLETAGASRILTMDLHSPQIQGFFRIPADQLLAAPIFFEYFNEVLFKQEAKEDFILVMADHGAAKQFSYYQSELKLDVAIVDKIRYDHNEKPIIRDIIGMKKQKSALIIDDEIASGSTLIEIAKFLKEKFEPKKIIAVAVHPILSGNAVKNLVESPINKIVVGNTVPVKEKIAQYKDRFEVLDLSPLFARAIQCIHNGDSLSELFPPSVRRRQPF